MTDTMGPGAGSSVDPGTRAAASRADGVVLLGEMEGSGYRRPPALARRGDGQTIQLTPLLYALLEALDGRKDSSALADELRARTDRPVTADNVDTLVGRLRELGLVARADGSEPELRRSNPLLALRLKVAVTDPERTRRITAPFARLFSPIVLVPVVLGFVMICWWVLVREGLAAATHDAFARPGLLLVVLLVTVLSAGFHEFGHAAAARRGGAQPGVMGAGLYLIWPAFYTDVTDSYRLGRGGRIRTDLGGLYFNAIIVIATFGTWWATGWDAVLLVVATQVLQMLRQLMPLVRFDGYHVLADLTGVPDLFQRIAPTLRALVPWRSTEPDARALKPWARTVVTAWVLAVVPLLLGTLATLVLAAPRVVGTALVSADGQRRTAGAAVGQGDLVAALAHGLAAVIVLLPVVASGYMFARLGRQVGKALWLRTAGRPGRRAVAILAALAVVAGLAWAWWPTDDRYRPVEAWEGGTIGDVVALARPAPADLRVGSQGSGTVYLPPGGPAPTREHPQLAAVLVPTGGTTATGAAAGGSTQGSGSTAGGTAESGTDTWIFPFDEPLAPGPDDNQAVAVNTTDGTATYDVAFALVWADPDQPVTTTNEAFAAASCEGCAAIAVAFQVVLVVGHADVAVPANLSVAANYDCSSCLTYSLAVQLFVTLDGPLSDDAQASVERLWQEVLEFGTHIADVPLSEIQAQLTSYEQQIIAVIEADQGPLVDSPDPSETPSPTASTSAAPTESATPTTGATSSPTSDTASTPAAGATSSSPTGSSDPSTAPSTDPSTASSSPTSSETSSATTAPEASASGTG